MKGNNCFFYILFSILLIMLFLLGNFYYIINKQNEKIGVYIENFDDFSPYQGKEFSASEIQEALLDMSPWITFIRHEDDESLVQAAAQAIANDNSIIGWFQGRSEFGQRALG